MQSGQSVKGRKGLIPQRAGGGLQQPVWFAVSAARGAQCLRQIHGSLAQKKGQMIKHRLPARKPQPPLPQLPAPAESRQRKHDPCAYGRKGTDHGRGSGLPLRSYRAKTRPGELPSSTAYAPKHRRAISPCTPARRAASFRLRA